MKKKKIIIITENLSPVMNIFKKLEKILPASIISLSYKQFMHKSFKTDLQTYNPIDLLILIEHTYQAEHIKDIQQYLDTMFSRYWPSLIKLHIQWDSAAPPVVDLHSRGNYLLQPDLDQNFQVAGLAFFLIQAMHTAELDFQVCDHISGSIKEIISAEMLKDKNQELEHKTKIDHLTQLYNRDTFYSMLKSNIQSAKRDLWRLKEDSEFNQEMTETEKEIHGIDYQNKPKGRLVEHIGKISLMMIDIDNFKQVNDSHGHLAGDEVLKTFSRLLRSPRVFRTDDIAGRFGGEEFTVILPHTNAENAKIPARRLMAELAESSFEGANCCEFKITVSIGISEYNLNDNIELDIIHRADMALYKAKELGRNMIVIYEDFFPDLYTKD